MAENKQPLDKHDENTEIEQKQHDAHSSGTGMGAGIAGAAIGGVVGLNQTRGNS